MRDDDKRCLRIAAAGDLHYSEHRRDEARQALARLHGAADLVLLAGDLTTHGEPEQAAVLADACAELEIPVFAVLGNHDWHVNRRDELVAALSEGGIRVLDRDWATCEAAGAEVGIVGVKGFVGGFGNQWANFGEPLFRQAYAETTADVAGLEAGLRAIESCAVRIALLHYSPVEATLVGEPERLWLVLGADRLAGPIRDHRPDLVVHGHAHHGSFEGEIDGVPVYNVAVHVMGREFWVFELAAEHGVHEPPLAVEET
jgi:Icc-related predicted phosphoesterase